MKTRIFEQIKVMGDLSLNAKKVKTYIKNKYTNVKMPIFVGVGGRFGGMIPSGHIIISTIEKGQGGVKALLQKHFWDYNFRSCDYVVLT